MRLGIDFDNTFADFGGLLRRVTLERTGFDIRAVREANPDAVNIEAIIHAAIGKARFDALIAEIVESDLTLEMEPRPGAIEVARRLAVRHEIVVITARTDTESDAPRRWLQRHAIPIVDVIGTAYASKAPHAIEQGLAVHLDDNVTVIETFDAAHPTVPALLAHPTNLDAPRAAHWRSVEDWLAFETLVQTLERER